MEAYALGAVHGSPQDVSCVNRIYRTGLFGFCAAVDFGGHVLYKVGASWSPPLVVDSHHLTAVSCSEASFCAAVDSSGYGLTLSAPSQYGG